MCQKDGYAIIRGGAIFGENMVYHTVEPVIYDTPTGVYNYAV